MPVITCPDCGRDVSTMAASCPHCGRPSPAGTAPMPLAQAAPAREETIWSGGPSNILLFGNAFGIAATLVLIPLIARFFAASMPDDDRARSLIRFGWIAAALLALLQLVALLTAWVRLRATSYTVTNQRVIVEQGIFSKTVDEIDLRYVDDSQFYQSLMDRILGIGTVTLVSSDPTTPRFLLRSIRDPRNVREKIRAEAYTKSQRQIFTRAT